MKFTIKTESNTERNMELHKFHLKAHFKKSTIALILLGSLILLFLIVGISTGDDYTMVYTRTKTIYYNLNFFTALGISSSLVLLYVLRQIHVAKKRFLKERLQLDQKIKEISYEFNDKEITIDYGLLYQKIDWKLFEKKTYHDKFIFLNFTDKWMDGIAINGELFTDSDFEKIKDYIDLKVKLY